MTKRELTVSAGDVARCALNKDEKDKSEQVLVLYPSPGNTVEVILYDGEKLIGMMGGGVRVNDILEIINHLGEDDYINLISRGKVGAEEKAREIYNRPSITYTLDG